MFEHVWTCLIKIPGPEGYHIHIASAAADGPKSARPPGKDICHAFICFLNTFGFDVCTRWEWIACDVTLPLCLLVCWLRRQWCDLVWSSSKGLSGWRGRKGPKRGLQELSKGETDRVFSGPWKHWQHQSAHFMESQVKRVSMYWYGLMWCGSCVYTMSHVSRCSLLVLFLGPLEHQTSNGFNGFSRDTCFSHLFTSFHIIAAECCRSNGQWSLMVPLLHT